MGGESEVRRVRGLPSPNSELSAAGCAPSSARTRPPIPNRVCTLALPVSPQTRHRMIDERRHRGLEHNPITRFSSFPRLRASMGREPLTDAPQKHKKYSLLILAPMRVIKALLVLTAGTVLHDLGWSLLVIHRVGVNCRALTERSPRLHVDVGERVMG